MRHFSYLAAAHDDEAGPSPCVLGEASICRISSPLCEDLARERLAARRVGTYDARRPTQNALTYAIGGRPLCFVRRSSVLGLD